AVADITRGEYFYARNAVDLKKVYQSLNAKLVMERKKTEVTALFSGLAALLAVVSAALSLAWVHRILWNNGPSPASPGRELRQPECGQPITRCRMRRTSLYSKSPRSRVAVQPVAEPIGRAH